MIESQPMSFPSLHCGKHKCAFVHATRIGLAQFILWVNPNLYSNPCLVSPPTFAPNFEDFIPEVQTSQFTVLCTSCTWSAGSSISRGKGGGTRKSKKQHKIIALFLFLYEKKNFVEIAKSSKGHFAKQKYT